MIGYTMKNARSLKMGVTTMGLKAPGILTLLTSVILVVAVLMIKFFGADIPGLKGNEFWVLLVAQFILVAGCLSRAL
jgi:hypothetical protein